MPSLIPTDLDLNSYADQDVYITRLARSYGAAGIDRDAINAEIKALKSYADDQPTAIEAIRYLAKLHIELVRRVEPETAKFRKVRAGWYSTAVVDWRETLKEISDRVPHADRSYEEYVDVSQEEGGEQWLVSTRGGREHQDRVSTLNRYSVFRQPIAKFADAKRYATCLRDYLKNKGPHPDWILDVFSREHEIAYRAKIEGIVGEPYDVWFERTYSEPPRPVA